MTFPSDSTKPHVTRDLLLYYDSDPPMPSPSLWAGTIGPAWAGIIGPASPPPLPTAVTGTIVPPPDALRTPRKPSIRTFVQRAEKATGKPVTAITMPDGTKLDFSQPESVAPENPWPLDEFRTKETKQ